MISVIIPLYNREKTILKTLRSLEQQTCQDLEIIIVNDGSTDGSEKAVAKYLSQSKSSIHFYFFNQKNQGAPAARNRGFQEARGEYLLFCDADAVLRPDALALMLSSLEDNPEISYVYSSFNWGKKLFKLDEFNPEKLRKMPYIHSLSLIRRRDFPVGGWDVNIKKFQDWDLWLTMLRQGKIGLWVPQVLFSIMPGGTISSWLPSFAYKLLPFLPVVKRYRRAMEVIKKKHGLL